MRSCSRTLITDVSSVLWYYKLLPWIFALQQLYNLPIIWPHIIADLPTLLIEQHKCAFRLLYQFKMCLFPISVCGRYIYIWPCTSKAQYSDLLPEMSLQPLYYLRLFGVPVWYVCLFHLWIPHLTCTRWMTVSRKIRVVCTRGTVT